MKLFTNIFVILTAASFFYGCGSSYKPRKRVQHVGHETKWDHEKIEQNKKYENASKPSKEQMRQWKEQELNCTIMSKEQMKRSQAADCQPVDPRQGHGEGMFCCADQ